MKKIVLLLSACTIIFAEITCSQGQPASSTVQDVSHIESPLDVVSKTTIIQELILDYLGRHKWVRTTQVSPQLMPGLSHMDNITFIDDNRLVIQALQTRADPDNILIKNSILLIVDCKKNSIKIIRNILDDCLVRKDLPVQSTLNTVHNEPTPLMFKVLFKGGYLIIDPDTLQIKFNDVHPEICSKDILSLSNIAYCSQNKLFIGGGGSRELSFWDEKYQKTVIAMYAFLWKLSSCGKYIAYTIHSRPQDVPRAIVVYNLITKSEIKRLEQKNDGPFQNIDWLADQRLIFRAACSVFIWDPFKAENKAPEVLPVLDCIRSGIVAIGNSFFTVNNSDLLEWYPSPEGFSSIEIASFDRLGHYVSVIKSPNDQFIATQDNYKICVYAHVPQYQLLEKILKARKLASQKLNQASNIVSSNTKLPIAGSPVLSRTQEQNRQLPRTTSQNFLVKAFKDCYNTELDACVIS